MRISAINNQQNYNNKPNFQGGKASGKAGAVIGGLTGLMMTGAMIATCPIDWHKITTWPVVAMALSASGAMQGKMIADIFSKEKNDEKEEDV